MITLRRAPILLKLVSPVHTPRVSSQLVRTLSISSRIMAPTPWTPNRYPVARRSDHIDTYTSEAKGEVKIHDPYEWLQHNTDETDKWTTAQEKFTREYLDANPDRVKLEEEIRKSTDYERVSFASGDSVNVGIESLPRLSVQRSYSEEGQPLVLVIQQRFASPVRYILFCSVACLES